MNTSDVALGDLDGDGDLDAFVANFNGPGVANGQINQVLINDGSAKFTAYDETGGGIRH